MQSCVAFHLTVSRYISDEENDKEPNDSIGDVRDHIQSVPKSVACQL